jgi:hypothetical protein
MLFWDLKIGVFQKNIGNLFLVKLLFWATIVPSTAQLNIKVGYSPAFGSFNPINNLFDLYNSENAETLENSFSNLHFLHGIDVGVRYNFANFAVEFGWENLNRDRSSLLYNPGDDTFTSELYKFSFTSLSLGFDTYINRFGFGAGIYSQKLRIRREIGNDNLNLVSQSEYALDLHVNIAFRTSSNVSFVLKPYYRLPLGSYNLQPFVDDLFSNIVVDLVPVKMGFYGARLVFYNGRQ